jgi:hypothetical protein
MKKWNLLFLILFVILFIISVIPMFNSMNSTLTVYFFYNTMKKFSTVYMPILFFGIVEWALLTLYLQSLFKDIKRQDATKFDLDK